MKEEEIKAFVFKTLMSATKSKPVSASEITLLVKTKFMTNFSPSAVRAIINDFRRHELPVLAGNSGYWISYEKDDVIEYIQSMINRIEGQKGALAGLQNLIKTL